VIEIYNKLDSIDLIIHLGDMERDARKISETLGKDVLSVKGNNESVCTAENFHILKTEYGNIFLTHGHIENVKSGLLNLLYKTQEFDCVAAFFGHTHRPHLSQEKGIYLLNPGSLTLPDRGSTVSYAVVNIAEDCFSASIMHPDS